jgi:hypothetical protein
MGLPTMVQWEGGSTFSVYGRSVRRLPQLDLSGLRETSATTSSLTPQSSAANASFSRRRVRRALNEPQPRIWFELFADGSYRKIAWLPVEFAAAEKSQSSAEGSKEIPAWI